MYDDTQEIATGTDNNGSVKTEYQRLLDALGRNADERMSICHKRNGGGFRVEITTVQESPDLVTGHAEDDCWYGTGVLHSRSTGRGDQTDVIGIRELFADLDVKPGGMPSWAAAHQVIGDVSAMLGTSPVAVVNSGHGLQPHWAIEQGDGTDWTDETSPEWTTARVLFRRFSRLVSSVAERHGGATDSVFDLSRILRVPGTTNCKGDPVPTTAEFENGSPVSLERLRDVLDEYAVPELSGDREILDTPISSPSEWVCPSKTTCSYVTKMVKGWKEDRPKERHKWLIAQATRIAAAHRYGCLSESGVKKARERLAERFETVLNIGARRETTPGEIRDAIAWGIHRVAAMDGDRVAHELGNHEHKTRIDQVPVSNETGPSTSERPGLEVTSPAVAAEWMLEELGRNSLAGVFRRGNDLVHTPRVGENGYIAPKKNGDDDGPAQIQSIDAETLAANVTFSHECYVTKETKEAGEVAVKALFPIISAKYAHKGKDLAPNLRTLRSITHTPIFRDDGTILDEPGYDELSEVLYLPEPGLEIPPVPEFPDAGQLATAVEMILAPVQDFGFITPDDKANWVGAMITPIVRNLVPPPYKMLVISAPDRGSGKTLLAELIGIIHGHVMKSEIHCDDEAEMRKQITSILVGTTAPVVVFDNVTGILKSPTLAGLLTMKVWSDRPLGSTEVVSIKNDRLLTITGNNMKLGGDLVRRSLMCTFDAGVPNPELREGFTIPGDLATWMRENRGDYLWALLTMCRSWVVAGRLETKAKVSDGFTNWIRCIGGILEHAGIPGRFGSIDANKNVLGADDQEWGEFLTAIHQRLGSKEWTVRALLESFARFHGENGKLPIDVLPDQLAELVRRTGRDQFSPTAVTRKLGKWCENRQNRWTWNLTVRRAGLDRTRTALWRVEQFEDSHREVGAGTADAGQQATPQGNDQLHLDDNAPF